MTHHEATAVLGLGKMGRAIADRLLLADRPLVAWNRSAGAAEQLRDAGATVPETPSQVWRHANTCITMLTDSSALEAVVLGPQGLLEGASGSEQNACAGGVLIDMSTVDAGASARIAARAAEQGVAYLRAPVSGNPSVVAAGNLTIVVSGPREVFDAQLQLIRDIGPHVFHVGDQEQARIVKLALNLMLAGTAQLLSEALVLCEKHGVDSGVALEVIGNTAVGSPFVKYKSAALAADDYTPTFTTTLLHKDVSLALAAAEEVRAPMPLVALVQQLTGSCIATGMGELDMMALLPRLRREAGIASDDGR